MRTAFKIAVGVVGAGALLGASAAAAAKFVATFTGTIANGHDYTGVFGPSGSSLDGDAFVAQYKYDTAVGIRTTIPGVSDHLDNVGPFGFPGGETATLKINGVTVAFAGTYSWSADAKNGFLERAVADSTTLLIFNYAYPPGFPPSLDVSFPLTPAPSGGAPYFLIGNSATGSFDNRTVQITAVPEPAIWTLMLTGLSGLGASLRLRRRLTITAAC